MRDALKAVVYGGLFLLPFLPLLVTDSLFFPFITGKNFGFRIIVEIIFAAWVLLALYDAAYRPRFSWILGSFGALLAVLFFADLFGENPTKSFWSNYERMEGFITILHLFLYFLVAASVLTSEKLWRWFLNTSLAAAALMAFYVFQQLGGNAPVSHGGMRVDGTLGNATYLAVYMLFHIFIALFLFASARVRWQQYLYGAFALIFGYILIQTATRGAILGLIGGLALTALYIAIFEKRYPRLRTIALGGVAFVVVISGAFFAMKDTRFVQESPILTRVASISLEEGETRFTLWGMAFEGAKEKPILGWGQGNFNYVFNEKYEPSLYDQEQWFDRVHNIFFDWLIAGGILGLAAYLFLYFYTVYRASVRPLFRKDEEDAFSVSERGVLLGLLAGYFFHNLFVFDNIVSYFLFVTVLALVHTRISTEIPALRILSVDRRVITQVAAPVVAVLLALSLYFINIVHIGTAQGIIRALNYVTAAGQQTENQAQQFTDVERHGLYMLALEEFEEVLADGTFSQSEAREQLISAAQRVYRSQTAPQDVKQQFVALADVELEKQIAETPERTRIYVFASAHYRATGRPEMALEQIARARELAPTKQQVLYEQAFGYMQTQNYEEMFTAFKTAFELYPENAEARAYYAAAAIYTDRMELVDELITDEYRKRYVQNELVAQALRDTDRDEELEEVFRTRIELEPRNTQYRISLAAIKREQGDYAAAVQVLEDAIAEIPGFKEQGERLIQFFGSAQPNVQINP